MHRGCGDLRLWSVKFPQHGGTDPSARLCLYIYPCYRATLERAVLFYCPNGRKGKVTVMKAVLDKLELAFAAFGGFIGWFLGGFDGFLYALVVFVVMDYFTGVLPRA